MMATVRDAHTDPNPSSFPPPSTCPAGPGGMSEKTGVSDDDYQAQQSFFPPPPLIQPPLYQSNDTRPETMAEHAYIGHCSLCQGHCQAFRLDPPIQDRQQIASHEQQQQQQQQQQPNYSWTGYPGYPDYAQWGNPWHEPPAAFSGNAVPLPLTPLPTHQGLDQVGESTPVPGLPDPNAMVEKQATKEPDRMSGPQEPGKTGQSTSRSTVTPPPKAGSQSPLLPAPAAAPVPIPPSVADMIQNQWIVGVWAEDARGCRFKLPLIPFEVCWPDQEKGHPGMALYRTEDAMGRPQPLKLATVRSNRPIRFY